MGAYDDLMTTLAPTFRWKLDGDALDSGFDGGTARNGTALSITYSSGGGIIPNEPTWENAIFNSVIDKITIADDPRINTGTGYDGTKRSISYWFELTAFAIVSTGHAIFSQGGTTTWWAPGYTLTDNKLWVTIGESASAKGDLTSTFTLSLNTLYHVVVTFDCDDEATGNNMKLYINGTLEDQVTTSIGAELKSHTGNVTMGDPDGNPKHTSGGQIANSASMRLQDLCYWKDVELTAAQVSDLYDAGSVPPPTEVALSEGAESGSGHQQHNTRISGVYSDDFEYGGAGSDITASVVDWTIKTGSWSLTGDGRLTQVLVAHTQLAMSAEDFSGNNHFSEVNMDLANAVYGGPIVRANAGFTNCWACFVNSSTSLELRRYVTSTTWTTTIPITVSTLPSNFDLRLESVGDDLKVYVDGSLEHTRNDSAYAANGNIGIFGYRSGFLYFKSWTGGELASTTTEAVFSEGAEAGETWTTIQDLGGVLVEGLKAGDLVDSIASAEGDLEPSGFLGMVTGETWTTIQDTVGGEPEGISAGDLVDSIALAEGDLEPSGFLGMVASDLFTTIQDTVGGEPEGISAGDLWTAEIEILGQFTEGLLSGDEVSTTSQEVAILAEGLVSGDVWTTLQDLQADFLEGLKAGDVWVLDSSIPVSFSEGILAGETWTTLQDLQAILAEGLKAGEALSATQATDQTITEGLLAGDTQDPLLDAQADLLEGLVSGETLLGDTSIEVFFTEGTKAGESLLVTATLTTSFTEGLVAGDVMETIEILGEFLEGALSGDGWDALVDYQISLTEGLVAGDSQVSTAIFEITFTEGMITSDVLSASKATLGSFIDGVISGETWGGSAVFTISFTEGLLAGDTQDPIQTALGQIIEGALSGDVSSGVTIVIDFIRLLDGVVHGQVGTLKNTLGGRSRSGSTGTFSRLQTLSGSRSTTNPSGTFPGTISNIIGVHA